MRKSVADGIEQYIKALIARNGQRQIEIQRVELAETFGCVPSQVTYVLSTRFTPAHGYITESRRGGKGYIRIREFASGPTDIPVLTGYLDSLLAGNLLNEREIELLLCTIREITAELPREYGELIRDHTAAALRRFLKSEENARGGLR